MSSTQLKLQYEGSVKRVFTPPAADERLWFEFSDDYSVFDWGKMPEQIASKGRALTVLGAVFFQKLAGAGLWKDLRSKGSLARLDQQWLKTILATSAFSRMGKQGLQSHFQQLNGADGQPLTLLEASSSPQPVFMNVLKADVQAPQPAVILGQTVYHYAPVPADSLRRLVPLEVVFRFGMPSGSSLKERLEKNPQYASQLGLSEVPPPGSWFARPVLEFFTKLEPKDRLLSVSEALLISGLTVEQFQSLTDISFLVSLALFDLFSSAGIELWDGKFEFILDGDQILLADSIGPDELRLIYKETHLSKEIIRQVYRDSSWEKAIKQGQELAAQRQVHDWKSICKNELQCAPENLPVGFKSAIDHLYPVLANTIAGEQLFANQPDLDGLVEMLSAAK